MDHSSMSGFKPGYGTAVWSSSLTPMSETGYIGALLGLFVLSVGFRALVAAQGYLEAYLHLHFYPRPHSHSPSQTQPPSTSTSHNPPLQNTSTQRGLDEDDQVNQLQVQLRVQSSSPETISIPASIDEKHTDNIQINNLTTTATPLSASQPPPAEQGVPPPPPPQQPRLQQEIQQVRKRYGRNNNTTYQSLTLPFNDAAATPTIESSLLFPLPTAQPFVWQAEVSRAMLTTLVIAVGYMLMLVIMTYNSAYLGVILAGVFVGELYFARWGRVRPLFQSTNTTTRTNSYSPHHHHHHHHHHNHHNHNPASPGQAVTISPSALNSISISINNSNSNSNNNNNDKSSNQQRPEVVQSSSSFSSARSSTSSRGYSSTMMHHGLSADGAC